MLLSTTVHRDRPREGQSSSRDIKWRDFEKQIPKVLLRRHFCTRHTTHTKAEKMFSVVSAVHLAAVGMAVPTAVDVIFGHECERINFRGSDYGRGQD